MEGGKEGKGEHRDGVVCWGCLVRVKVGWRGWEGRGWDGMGWEGMGGEGMGWDGMGRDGRGVEVEGEYLFRRFVMKTQI